MASEYSVWFILQCCLGLCGDFGLLNYGLLNIINKLLGKLAPLSIECIV